MKKSLALLALLPFSGLASCERVVTIDLDDPEPQLVVEGRMLRQKTGEPLPQRVRLSWSGPVFSPTAPPPASGA